MDPRLDRRSFLLGSAGALSLLTASASARPRARSERTLVLIQLSGGNDGLSMLVPYADDGYGRARKATRLGAERVLRLDERVGLHPGLGGLRALYDEGRLALIEGIGYPEPNRSHFRSLDIWHAADARGRGTGVGWIGRCAERLVNPVPHSVVHLGPRAPFSVYSARRAPLCLTPTLLRARPTSLDGASLREASSDARGDTLELVRGLLSDVENSTALLAEALEHPPGRARYPGSGFARDLRMAAALVHAAAGVRVVALELDGFDTHRDQRNRYERLMDEFDGGLSAFLQDLQASEAGREALVVLYSEFGRRVEENASGGTDHGSGGLALVLGGGVRGGLHGRPPSLEVLADGDLAFTTDFRRLYATCIEHVFGFDPSEVLGGEHAPLALV